MREREEVFEDVVLGVKGHTSLYTSLAEYIAREKLHGSNKYFCETCNAKVLEEREREEWKFGLGRGPSPSWSLSAGGCISMDFISLPSSHSYRVSSPF